MLQVSNICKLYSITYLITKNKKRSQSQESAAKYSAFMIVLICMSPVYFPLSCCNFRLDLSKTHVNERLPIIF